MRYASGKSRISRQISETILQNVRGGYETSLISLFCGSCSVESKLAPYFDDVICNDKQEYLIALFNGVKNGYELPEIITEEKYKYIREHKDEDKVLTGFVGFGCSFAGKFFGGYARNKTNTNYAKQSKTSLLKDMATLMNTKFINEDYKNVVIPENSVIYADPPYKGTTTGYGIKGKFDSDEFWEYARNVSKTNIMFISELQAPEDFIAIWEKPFTRTMDRNKDNQFKTTEKLFVHKCNYEKYKMGSVKNV